MGIKLAAPEKEVICFVGDGSYMMANSELAAAVVRRVPFTVVLTDNRGYGCINRLQIECGGAEFNNMYKDCNLERQPEIDFVAHARAMGAHAEKVPDIAALERALIEARGRDMPVGDRHRHRSGSWHRRRRALVGRGRAADGRPGAAGEGARDIQRQRRFAAGFRLTDAAGKSPTNWRTPKDEPTRENPSEPMARCTRLHRNPPAGGMSASRSDRLRAGESAAEATGDHEVILVMVEGKAAVTAAGQDWGVLGDRMYVFEKTPPHCLYVPNGADWQAVAETDCTLAVCSAPARMGTRRGGSDRWHRTHRAWKGSEHPLHQQHRDGGRRLLRQPAGDGSFHAVRQLVLISQPPTRRGRLSRITYLEETYYHRINPANGLAFSGLHRGWHA